jgi:Undecaprenyl-phosphate glucose phosphotransferase
MIRGRLKRTQLCVNLATLLTPLFAFGLAGYVRFATRLLPRYSSDADPFSYFGLLILTSILWAIVVEHYGLASLEAHSRGKANIRAVTKACMVTYLAVLAITFFYRETTFSRLFIWLSGLNLFLLTLVQQRMLRWFLASSWTRQGHGPKALVIGADEFAGRVAQSLLSDHVAPCTVYGHVRIPGQHVAIQNLPVYQLDEIDKLAIGNAIDDVVLAIPPDCFGELREIRKKLSSLCAPMRLVLDVGEPIDSRQRVFSVGNLLMLDLQGTPAESELYIILKRAFDLIFSGAVLIFTAPLFILISVAVRLSSPGPVFFVQERVGLNGKLFRMIKFRTMSVASRADSDTRWTVKNDPRCTPVGRILRRSGLDEIPQFFNVLKGDMSVVGPRPERPMLVQKFMQSVGNYNRRHYLKVGITGWAQVNGWRGDTSIEKRIEYDLYYVRHWTLSLDFLIVLLTLVRGFTDKNAY